MKRRYLLALAVLALAGCGGTSPSVHVPHINLEHLDLAVSRLHETGLRATFAATSEPCGYTTLPVVTHQHPAAGSRVPIGSVVSFSFGPQFIPSPLIPNGPHPRWVRVPRLVGKSSGVVARTLPESILPCLRVQGARAQSAARLVLVSQHPAPGARVRAYGRRTKLGFVMTTVKLYYELRP
jgi:hypothetical protein